MIYGLNPTIHDDPYQMVIYQDGHEINPCGAGLNHVWVWMEFSQAKLTQDDSWNINVVVEESSNLKDWIIVHPSHYTVEDHPTRNDTAMTDYQVIK